MSDMPHGYLEELEADACSSASGVSEAESVDRTDCSDPETCTTPRTDCSEPETCTTPSIDGFQSPTSPQSEDERESKVTTCAELLAVEGNNKCFDCNAEGPLWVNMSYCIFLCAPCATIHGEFGLQLKPLSDHSLPSEDLALLGKTGNKVASGYWLATWDNEFDEWLAPQADKDVRTRCIIEKYRGRWLLPDERIWLTKQQHAFCSQPGMYPHPNIAFYGPTYTSFEEGLVSQAQQLSLNPHPDGGGHATEGGFKAEYANNGNAHANGSEYPNENGYASGGYGDGSGYINGYSNNGQMHYHSNSEYANMHANMPANGYANGHANEYANGYASGYANGLVNAHASGYTNGRANAQANGHLNRSGKENRHAHGNGNGMAYVYMNGNGTGKLAGLSARNDLAPSFVMNSTVMYTKKSRRRRHVH